MNPEMVNPNQASPSLNPIQVAEAPKKCKHMPIIITLAILAVAGISFGGFELWQNMQKDTDIKNLQTDKIKLEEKENIVLENGDIALSNVAGGPYIENGYFYVPEWGLKFNIPSDLTNYGYSVDYDSAHVGYTLPEIGFTAMLKSDELQGAQAAYYDNIQTCSMVNVSREDGTWPDDRIINGLVKQFDDYALLIWNYSSHGSCDYNLHIDEVQEKIQTMFSNPEKIQ